MTTHVETRETATASRKIPFLGVTLDALTMAETVARVAEIIERRDVVQHVAINVAKLVTLHKDGALRQAVNGCGLVSADGAGIVWGARLLGLPIPERVAGIDLMQALIRMAAQRGYRIFLFGAEETVVRKAMAHYQSLYPTLQIAGYRNGYYRVDEEVGIVEQIRDSRPDMLFVAMGTPQKETFLSHYLEQMAVPFAMGVGGSFDVIAGKVKRAPAWMQVIGAEWFYRFIQEPRRLARRYLVTNSEYLWMLLRYGILGRPFSNG